MNMKKELSVFSDLLNGIKKSCTSDNIYDCFDSLRKEMPDVKFLCKGVKINFHTSGMSSQMSNDIVAYELIMGQSGGETVNIFDPEDNDLTNDIQEQHDFYKRWVDFFNTQAHVIMKVIF